MVVTRCETTNLPAIDRIGMRFGADEAGKGPVLGSMFGAAVLAEPGVIPDGVDDSKRLPPARRETLAAAMRDSDGIRIGVAEIPTTLIDDPQTDMNTLTVKAHVDALSQVVSDGHQGVVDAGDTSEARFGDRVAGGLDADVTVDARHGADEEDPLVAAASVIAKVERDAHVSNLAETYDAPLGSGYPSDETTVEFLTGYVGVHGKLPPCARETWSTSQRVLAETQQSDLGDF